MRKMKHFVATVLSMGMVLAGSVTSLAAEPPIQQPEEPASIEGTARIIILPDLENTRHNVKGDAPLRAEPSLNGALIDWLHERNHHFVILNGEAEIIDNITWLRVTSSSIGKSGWIASIYLY